MKVVLAAALIAAAAQIVASANIEGAEHKPKCRELIREEKILQAKLDGLKANPEIGTLRGQVESLRVSLSALRSEREGACKGTAAAPFEPRCKEICKQIDVSRIQLKELETRLSSLVMRQIHKEREFVTGLKSVREAIAKSGCNKR